MQYTIRQLVDMFQVTEHTIRYYTDTGLLPCKRDGGNRRVFDEESINWMQGITCLKGCGASIEEIRQYCELCKQPESRENLEARYQLIRNQREQAYKRLEEAKIRWLIWNIRCYIIRKSWQDWRRMIRIPASGPRETGHSSIENRRMGYDCRNLS